METSASINGLPKINSLMAKTFYIQPKIINDYTMIFPSKANKKICLDNEGFFLLEPRTNFLKKGTVFKFKVRFKGGVNNVCLLDGNQFFFFKKIERDIFEGEKKIENDNVSICCLRKGGVYTEVFRFKIIKEKSVDSSKFMMNIIKKHNNRNNLII